MEPATESKPGLIFQKIPAVMHDIEAIGKNRSNTQQNFKFRGVDDIYNELHSILAKHKVFTVPTILNRQYAERKTAKGSIMMERILTIQYRIFAEDGSYIDAVVDGEAMDTGDKTTAKCMSIAHKYAFLQVFCIPTEDAKDPDQNSPEAYTDQRPPQSKGGNIVKIKPKGESAPPAAVDPQPDPLQFLKDQVKALSERAKVNKDDLKTMIRNLFDKGWSQLEAPDFQRLIQHLSQPVEKTQDYDPHFADMS